MPGHQPFISNEIYVTFLRHGRSRADEEEVHEGRYDSPLTNEGKMQALRRAQEFLSRDLLFDAIVSSTLQRAQATAAIIGELMKVPVETDPDWMEFNNGPLAGLPIAVAAERYPRPVFKNPYEPLYGTGESDWEIFCRAARAVENIVRRGPGRYLVVAHGGILNSAMRAILGAQPFANEQGIAFRFNDTGFVRSIYYPSQNLWILLEFTPGL